MAKTAVNKNLTTKERLASTLRLYDELVNRKLAKQGAVTDAALAALQKQNADLLTMLVAEQKAALTSAMEAGRPGPFQLSDHLEIDKNGSRIRFKRNDGEWSPWLNTAPNVSVGVPETQRVSGTVALDTASLSALELVGVKGLDANTIATATNPVPVRLDSDSLVALEDINVTVTVAPEIEIKNDAGNPVPVSDAGGSLTVDGTVAVSNFPSTQTVNGTVELGATTLAALENTTVTVSNFPAVQPVSDNGSSLTVDGTVELGSTTLAALESITVQNGAGVSAVNIQDGGNSITVDGSVTATVSGSVEITNDVGNPIPVNGTVAVSSVGGTVAVTQSTSPWVVSGTVAATQSGTWNIGSIAGSISPGTSATNLGKAEDAIHSSGDVGIMALAVRNDNGTTTFGADGDYSPIAVNANGLVGITTFGVNLPVAATQSGSWSVTADTELPAAVALADATANPTAPAVGAFNELFNGTNWDRARSMPATFGALNANGVAASGVVGTDGATLYPVHARNGNTDTEPNSNIGLQTNSRLQLYDGTQWVRSRGNANGLQVQGASASGGSAAYNPLLVAGSDGASARTISTNASGHVAIQDGGNSITIDASSLPLPTGASTLAEQQTQTTSLSARNNAFATLMNALPDTTGKEVRMDDVAAGDLYIGRNTDGTSTATASWEVVRIYRNAVTAKIERVRYRTGVAWDSRTAGW